MNRSSINALFSLISAVALLVATGCEPELSEEELGRVEYRMPDDSEIGRKYELPDLSPDEPAEATDEGEAVDAEEAGANSESAG